MGGKTKHTLLGELKCYISEFRGIMYIIFSSVVPNRSLAPDNDQVKIGASNTTGLKDALFEE